jgi:hypothetical protein
MNSEESRYMLEYLVGCKRLMDVERERERERYLI